MQKRLILPATILLIAVTTLSCSTSKHNKTTRLPGVWQAQPIIVDGKNTDWSSPYPQYDENAMLGFAVSNDKDNLYITVETGDLATQLKILTEGLTVWIDKTGSEEEVTAINYPLPAPENDGKRNGSDHATASGGGNEQKQRIVLEDKVRKALTEATEYSLQGFKACNLQFPILAKDSCGIVVRIDIDADNELVWEAVVPFKSFYFKPEVERRDKGKPMNVCFETTAMKRPAGQSSGDRENGGRRGGGFSPGIGFGGMGMGMGMRMGGGGGGMRGGNRNTHQTPDIMEPAYKATRTIKKFGIAFQN